MGGEAQQPQLTWIWPLAAAGLLAPLYDDTTSAQAVLVQHAAAGLVRSFCRRKTDTPSKVHSGTPATQDNAWIDRSFWEAFADQTRRTFTDWGTGSFGANIFQGPRGKMDWWSVRVFHVAFCEEDIRAIPGVAPKPPPIETIRAENLENWGRLATAFRDGLKTLSAPDDPDVVPPTAMADVTYSEVLAWHLALPLEDRMRGIRWLRQEARKAFHPRRVLQKNVDPLVEGRPLGRPARAREMSRHFMRPSRRDIPE